MQVMRTAVLPPSLPPIALTRKNSAVLSSVTSEPEIMTEQSCSSVANEWSAGRGWQGQGQGGGQLRLHRLGRGVVWLHCGPASSGPATCRESAARRAGAAGAALLRQQLLQSHKAWHTHSRGGGQPQPGIRGRSTRLRGEAGGRVPPGFGSSCAGVTNR